MDRRQTDNRDSAQTLAPLECHLQGLSWLNFRVDHLIVGDFSGSGVSSYLESVLG